jgi:hypothetical protein
MQPDSAPHALPAYSIRPDSCRGLTSTSGLGPQAIAQGKFLEQRGQTGESGFAAMRWKVALLSQGCARSNLRLSGLRRYVDKVGT